MKTAFIAVLLGALAVYADEPPLTACELKERADALHAHSLVVAGRVEAGFEGFAFLEADCPRGPGIWITYGGVRTTGIIYCCPGEGGRKKRLRPFDLNGYKIPLTEDGQFRKLDRAVRKGGTMDVKLRGFFLSRQGNAGYGHFGAYHLFVVEQVFDVRPIPK
jgi:hypothetical protein